MWPLAKLGVCGGGDIPLCEKSRPTQYRAMKFSYLILRKIVKIVATRGQILRRKCTKCDFGWSSAPDLTGGAYSAPQTPYLDFRGPTSTGGEGGGRNGKWKGREKKGGREEGKVKGEGGHPQGLVDTPRCSESWKIPCLQLRLPTVLRSSARLGVKRRTVSIASPITIN